MHGPRWAWVRFSLALGLCSMLVGSVVALFLVSLDAVTAFRWRLPWLILGLPLAGVAIAVLYQRSGPSVDGGNNRILDQIHAPSEGVPKKVTPLVLVSTLVTHLFGGSAGREGTAVQMGGSLASAVASSFKLSPKATRTLLISGMAAGFGAVFGTPMAGAIFAIEVLMRGRLEWRAFLPSLVAAWLGHWTCSAWGIQHTVYEIVSSSEKVESLFFWDGGLIGTVVIASVVFGGVAFGFNELLHRSTVTFKRLCASAPTRAFIGGSVVVALALGMGNASYLGLSVESANPGDVSLKSFFETQEWHPWAWWWKMIFTVITLSSGFKGGEVTPLFFIGAATGNALAGIFNAPGDLLAALGWVAVFSAATKTPLASTVLAVELFGWSYFPYFALACYLAYFCSGKSSLYLSQRLRVRVKNEGFVTMTVKAWRDRR